MNSAGKYLTAESFGCRVNASATVMKRKQIWSLEQDSAHPGVVYVRAHTGNYLAGDSRGQLTCDRDTREPETAFQLEYAGDGRWRFRCNGSGYFVGGTDDNVRCYEKTAGDSESWIARLATHPQVGFQASRHATYLYPMRSEQRILRLVFKHPGTRPIYIPCIARLATHPQVCFQASRHAAYLYPMRSEQRITRLVFKHPGTRPIYIPIIYHMRSEQRITRLVFKHPGTRPT